VDFPDESEAEGEPLPKAAEAMVQGPDIVGNLDHVIEGNPWRLLVLEGHQVG
jgi:hypothetical protein